MSTPWDTSSNAPVSAAEDAAMTRAFWLARQGPRRDPNPAVGCVILSSSGDIVGEGFHRGRGTDHAEVAALADVRRRDPALLRGATAVVTLEPCRHTGRTGPCVAALVEGGIARVIYAVPDPDPAAGGGGAELASHGVSVVAGWRRDEGDDLLRDWLAVIRSGRPYVIAKFATSLDGRIAASDGTSQWISGEESRRHAHWVRSRVDAIVVGTGTVLDDDPQLTVRLPTAPIAAPAQEGAPAPWNGPPPGRVTNPLRVVMGHRDIPAHARVRGQDGAWLHLRTHDPQVVIDAVAQRGGRWILIEGGGHIAGAFFGAGLVDEIHAYVSPTVLGQTRGAVTGWAVPTIGVAPRWGLQRAEALGDDVLIVARPRLSEES